MYYHEIAIDFIEVSRMSIDAIFSIDNDRDVFSVLPEKKESGCVVAIVDDEGNRHEVTCEDVEVMNECVKYYDDSGKRIDWREKRRNGAGRTGQ